MKVQFAFLAEDAVCDSRSLVNAKGIVKAFGYERLPADCIPKKLVLRLEPECYVKGEERPISFHLMNPDQREIANFTDVKYVQFEDANVAEDTIDRIIPFGPVTFYDRGRHTLEIRSGDAVLYRLPIEVKLK